MILGSSLKYHSSVIYILLVAYILRKVKLSVLVSLIIVLMQQCLVIYVVLS